MRSSPLIIAAVLSASLGGCCTNRPAPALQPAATQISYRPATAAALAFDPPIAMGQPMPDFSRDGRSPSAFAGYEDAVTTVSSLYQRDEIRSNRNGRFGGQFDRQAFTARTSVTTR